jgi:PPOX class probable F420-dependent enzyme
MSRREQIRMSEAETAEFLRRSKTIILVSNGRDGYPHPMPMWFNLAADGAINMTTYSASQKVSNLQRDPRVSLLVESGLEYGELRGVVMYGKAELISDTERVIDTLVEASGRGSDATPQQLAALRGSMRRTAAKRVVIRVVPDRVVSWDHAKLGGAY